MDDIVVAQILTHLMEQVNNRTNVTLERLMILDRIREEITVIINLLNDKHLHERLEKVSHQ